MPGGRCIVPWLWAWDSMAWDIAREGLKHREKFLQRSRDPSCKMTSILSRSLRRSDWSTRSAGSCVHPRHGSSGEDPGGGGLFCLYLPLAGAAPPEPAAGGLAGDGQDGASPEQFLTSEGTRRLRRDGCCAGGGCFACIPRDAARGAGARRGPGPREQRWPCWGRRQHRSVWPLPATCPLEHLEPRHPTHPRKQALPRALHRCILLFQRSKSEVAGVLLRTESLSLHWSLFSHTPHPSKETVEARIEAPSSLALAVPMGRSCPQSRMC